MLFINLRDSNGITVFPLDKMAGGDLIFLN
jgi:hypothetical protein